MLVSLGVLTLTVIQGPDRGRRFQLPDAEPQLIGRSSEALPITDNTVSRRHAELTPDRGGWWVRDLQSQNGTYVNGERILDRRRLSNGDQIRVGASVFLYGTPAVQRPEVLRLLQQDELDIEIEHTLSSNDDSMVLAEPEPAAAAADHLRVVYELVRLTTQVLDRHSLLSAAMELIFSEFKPERGFIVLLEAGDDAVVQPTVVKYQVAPKSADEATINVSRTILQHVLRRGTGVLSTNAMSDPRFAAGDSIQQYSIRSAICSPIRHRQRIFGAIYIDSSMANYTFTKEQLALMNAIGQHTGLALANAELQAEKLQSERLAAIGETVASLSHSIKNILQGMRGGADVVEMGLKKDDLSVARNGWGILKRNLERIVSLSMNMLAFSRQRPVEVEFQQLGPIVDECVSLLELPCGAKGVALIADVDPEMPPIPLDSSLIHQGLMNLMTNALEAVEERTGTITVRATYKPPGQRGEGSPPVAEISVIDNGPGVPADLRQRIFEPFSTTKGTRGTGLGLAVTKRVVEEHGGRIFLGDGEGATFTITLPADTGRVRDPSETATDRPDFSGV